MKARLACYVMCGFLLVASVGAQQPNATPRLVPIGTVSVRGSGEVVCCLIAADGNRALTVGSEHDLVYWDLAARRPLRHIARFVVPIESLRLHPTALLATVGFARGKYLRIDLATGKLEPLAGEQVDALPLPEPEGWLTAAAMVAEDGGSVSANGKYRIAKGRRVPDTPGQRFRGQTWIANDGTVLEAEGAALRMWGLVGASTEFFEHVGVPQHLVFSPDGRRLAIASLGGIQFVDAAGNEVARVHEPRLVQPGPNPDEFWVLDADAMRRWSGTRKRFVGEPVTWPWRHLRLVEWNEYNKQSLRPVLVRQGQPWTPDAARMVDGSFRPLVFARPQQSVPLGTIDLNHLLGPPELPIGFVSADESTAPILLTSKIGTDSIRRSEATLRRLGDDGATTHHVSYDDPASWLAMARDGTRVWVGMQDGTLHAYEANTLAPLGSKNHSPALTAAVVLDSGHLLAVSGKTLVRLDAASLAVVDTLSLPDPPTRIEKLACSADGRRVAISTCTEVHLFAVE